MSEPFVSDLPIAYLRERSWVVVGWTRTLPPGRWISLGPEVAQGGKGVGTHLGTGCPRASAELGEGEGNKFGDDGVSELHTGVSVESDGSKGSLI